MELTRLSILSDEDLTRIHEASLNVLARTGVYVHGEKVLKLFAGSDAEVDYERRIVRIPKQLVEESLASTPQKISLCDRNREPAVELGDGSTYVACGQNCLYILDSETQKVRKVTKEDVATLTKIADALENIHIIGIPAMPQDVMPEASLVHAVNAVFNSSEKHMLFSTESLEVTQAIYDIARVVTNESDLSKSPILTCQLSPTSPLTWEKGTGDALIETAASGVPCQLLPEPIAGVTAPLTPAGELVVHNAEFLSGLVITQLVRKGTPVIYGQAWTTFDMREANVLTTSPEACILRIAGTQLAKFYRIPSHSESDSDAVAPDEQNGWEKALSAFIGLNVGVDLLLGAGMRASGFLTSFEQLVIDNEIAGMFFRFLQGMQVSSEAIATDLIQKVGPRGNFLREDHTIRHLRSGEYWQPSILNRSGYQMWEKKGYPTIRDNAKKRALEIIETHHPKELSGDVRREIDRILRRFEEKTR